MILDQPENGGSVRKSYWCFILIILISLLSNFYSAIARDELTNGLKLEEIDVSKYLNDLPTPTKENLRFLLPAGSDWQNFRAILAKGSYLNVITRFVEVDKKAKSYSGSLDFYSNKDLSGKPVLHYQNHKLLKGKEEICVRRNFEADLKSKDYYVCGMFYCYKGHSNDEVPLDNYFGLNFDLMSKDSNTLNKKCSEKIEVFETGSNDSDSGFSLKLANTPSSKMYAEVLVGDKVLYLDTRFCIEKPELCEFHNIAFSEYERAWINMKYSQEKKNYENLNYFIEKLLPCVVKNDRVCVKKFFATKDDYDVDAPFPYPLVIVTDQVMKDLKKCLSYESLLPFGGRTKAEDDRVCIFKRYGHLIYSITLPDAYYVKGLHEPKVNYSVK